MCYFPKKISSLWYNEHKSAHLKSSLWNFICVEKPHKIYGMIYTLY